MKKYFALQTKLAGRVFPFVLCVTFVILLGLGVALYSFLASFQLQTSLKTYSVAITGDTDNEYLQWGISALQTIDEKSFSLELVEKTQEEAHAALERGEIYAYVVLPENFMEKALAGEIEPVTYVTSTGLEGMASLLKKEITDIVTDIVVYSQKGSIGLEQALAENSDLSSTEVADHMTGLTLGYTDLIIHRDRLYSMEELGLSDSLKTREYYLCVGMLLVFVLCGIPFAVIYTKRDYALPRLLLSRGYGPGMQLLCEYCVHFLSLITLMLPVILGVSFALPELISWLEAVSFWGLFLRCVAVLLMVAALNMLLFTLCNSLISGLMLHCFCAAGLCYLSGCIYPISTFPKGLQRFSSFLPTSCARQCLASAFSDRPLGVNLLGLAFYTVGFLAIALVLRIRRTGKSGR